MVQRLTVRHGREFVKHVVPALVKPARTLWNEVIGFLFLCIAVIFGFKTVRIYMEFAKPGSGTGEIVRLGVAGFCTLILAYYGISSFLRARRISRS